MAASEFDQEEQESLKEFEETVRKNGVAAIPGEIKRRLEKWKEISLHVAVTGASGVGKSTFINTIRRIMPNESGAAAVGETETTMEPSGYPHPRNPKVVFWDLPGVGTAKFPRESYLDMVKFDTYDFFILISNNRFTQDDLWLAKEVQKKGKQFYFVRSKFDESVRSDKKRNPRHNLQSFAKTIREHISKHLTDAGFTSPNIFLICDEEQLYDFEALEKTFIKDLPGLKREVALFTTQSRSVAIIKEKTKMLKGRIWKVAAISAAVAAVPIPGTSIVCDAGMIMLEIQNAKEAYGLDNKSLQKLSVATGVSMDTILLQVQQHGWLVSTGIDTLAVLFGEFAAEMALEEVARYIPIIGTAIACTLSFTTSKLVLGHCIDCMESAAINVVKITLNSASEV